MQGAAGLGMLLPKLKLDFVQESEGYLPSKFLVCHHQVRCSTTNSLSHLFHPSGENGLHTNEASRNNTQEAKNKPGFLEEKRCSMTQKQGNILRLANLVFQCDMEQLTVSPVDKVVERMMIAVEYNFGVGRRTELVQALNRHSCKVACKFARNSLSKRVSLLLRGRQ